jgi:hypothetical protein
MGQQVPQHDMRMYIPGLSPYFRTKMTTRWVLLPAFANFKGPRARQTIPAACKVVSNLVLPTGRTQGLFPKGRFLH